MNEERQVEAYSNANFNRGDNAFMVSLVKFLDFSKLKIRAKSLVIDLGCGPGKISEKLCEKWPSANIIGIDGSELMLNEARKRVKDKMRSPSYLLGGISDIAKGNITFHAFPNLIVSNSLMHHLHNPFLLWESLKKISAPGTLTFHRDLRRPCSEEQVIYLQKKYLPSSPEILVRDYLASLRASFTCEEIENHLENIGLSNFKVREVDEQYLEVFGQF